MKIRFRSLAAVMALLTLSLFWAERVWASMCPPEMEMHRLAGITGEMGQGADSCSMGTPLPGDSDEDRSDPPHCPFPAGISSCAGGVALAADVGTPDPPSPEHTSPIDSPDHARDLLLAIAPFHPPRA